MTNRIRLNLVVFALLAVVTISWSAITLFEFDRIERPYSVTAHFESSPGLTSGFEVTYLGHAIGTIDDVTLRDGYSEVELKIDRDTELPAAVDAGARRKSAIGEPYVDLVPSPGTDPDAGDRLEDGDVIPVERTSSAISYAALFSAVDELVAAIDPQQLQTVVDETATALDGRGDDLRSIIVGADDLTAKAAANADEIDALIDDLGSLTSTLADNRDGLDRALDGLLRVTETLESSQDSIDGFLTETPGALALLSRILEENDGSLLCTLDGLGSLDDVADEETLAALSGTLDDARTLIDTLDSVTESGYLQVLLQLSPQENARRYPERRPVPQAPGVPGCPSFEMPSSEVDTADAAPLGDGGDFTPTPDGPTGTGDGSDDLATSPTGDSDLDAPGESLLQRILDVAIPAVVLALLALLAVLAGRRLLAARATGPTEPAPLGDDTGADDT